MNQLPTSTWDESVKEATRRAFEYLSFNTSGDQVHLKHIQGHFGSIELEKALRGELHIQLKNDMGLVFYKTLDALIEAGWVLDNGNLGRRRADKFDQLT